MDLKEIQELLKAVKKNGLSEVSIKDGDFEICIKQEMNSDAAQIIPVPQAAMPAFMPQMTPQMQTPVAPQATPAAAPAGATAAPADDNSKYVTVKSPMIGTFYRSEGPDKDPFVSVGDTIKVGQTLCIVEAMKLFNEIESDVAGTIVKILIDDASPVEYDQPLFLVDPE